MLICEVQFEALKLLEIILSPKLLNNVKELEWTTIWCWNGRERVWVVDKSIGITHYFGSK